MEGFKNASTDKSSETELNDTLHDDIVSTGCTELMLHKKRTGRKKINQAMM